MSRDWQAAEAAKAAHWQATAKASGPAAMLEIGDALREHARGHAPSAFSSTARARDLADHVRLKRRIDEASARLRR